MKNLLYLLLVMLCISSPANAQVKKDSVGECISFKGIKIDGDTDAFIKKMKDEGFLYQEKEDNIVTMKGKFINENCTLFILYTPQSNIVCKVVVFFDKHDSWHSIKNSYLDVTELFTKKYGNPSSDYAFFSKPYYEGDGYELQALRNDKCTYTSFWTLKNSAISTSMTSTCKVSIAYENTINMKKMKEEKEKTKLEEI